MAKVTCAISGIRFTTDHLLELTIPHTQGYFHPIFACTYSQLHHLYTAHCKGLLPPKDSYLVFLAFLHSTEQIRWKAPVSLDPNSTTAKQLIENNLAQLIEVIEKTGVISHPSFIQPNFVVTYDNCRLEQIPNWVRAWKSNIQNFYSGKIAMMERENLQKVENKLSRLILSGEKPERYSHIIADWACKAAEFPNEHSEKWKLTIRSCFNITKMFNTPLPLLKEIKDYCECNIEVGSIHFHTLSKVLNEGISRHVDYLGGSSLALGYTLLPVIPRGASKEAEAELKNRAEIVALAAKAPEKYPVRADYASSLEFLRAKLAFSVATYQAEEAEVAEELVASNINKEEKGEESNEQENESNN